MGCPSGHRHVIATRCAQPAGGQDEGFKVTRIMKRSGTGTGGARSAGGSAGGSACSVSRVPPCSAPGWLLAAGRQLPLQLQAVLPAVPAASPACFTSLLALCSYRCSGARGGGGRRHRFCSRRGSGRHCRHHRGARAAAGAAARCEGLGCGQVGRAGQAAAGAGATPAGGIVDVLLACCIAAALAGLCAACTPFP